MRQPIINTNRNRLLIFSIIMLSTICSQLAIAQKPTVKIINAVAVKNKLLLKIEILRFQSQNMTLELKHMNSNLVQRFTIDKTLVTQTNQNCNIKLELEFPPGDIQLILFNEMNIPICSHRRQNTEENAKYYDPTKGNN